MWFSIGGGRLDVDSFVPMCPYLSFLGFPSLSGIFRFVALLAVLFAKYTLCGGNVHMHDLFGGA